MIPDGHPVGKFDIEPRDIAVLGSSNHTPKSADGVIRFHLLRILAICPVGMYTLGVDVGLGLGLALALVRGYAFCVRGHSVQDLDGMVARCAARCFNFFS